MITAGLGLLSAFLWLGFLATAVLALQHQTLRFNERLPVLLARARARDRLSDQIL
jgi:hypothetical protein